jgi:hemolysin III
VGLGWVAVFVLTDILHIAGVASLVLLAVGGVLYTLGGIAYALKRPNPVPGVFGYHEVFHAMTVVAAVCHYIAVYFAVYHSPFL